MCTPKRINSNKSTMRIGSFKRRTFFFSVRHKRSNQKQCQDYSEWLLLKAHLPFFDASFAVDITNWSRINHLFSQWYDSATKQKEFSDKLALLILEHYKKINDGDKDALTKSVGRIAKSYPLSFPSHRNEAMQKRFLKKAVSGSDWPLHVDKQTSTTQWYQQYVDSLLSAIRTASRHKQTRNDNETQHGILYVEQKRYGSHPSQSSKPSSISNAINNHHDMKRTLHNQCFNCWTPDSSFKTCKHPRHLTCTKRNPDDRKRLQKNDIHFADINTGGALEVCMVSEIIDFEHTEPSPSPPTPLPASPAKTTIARANQFAQEPLTIYIAFEQ